MATVALESFLPEIYPECPGVPQPVAVNAIRNACFDFCYESQYWNEVQASVAYTAANAAYTLAPVADTQVVGVLSLNMNEAEVVYPSPLPELIAAKPDWATAQGAITTFVQPALDAVTLVAVPEVSGYFIPTVAYAPARTAATVDARLYNIHLETIRSGALWKLKRMLTQPWADATGAAMYERMFWAGVGNATIARNKGNSNAALRIAPRPFV